MARRGAAKGAGAGALTKGEFDAYLLFVAFVAFACGILNLMRSRKRWLGAGAVCLGAAALIYRMDAPMWTVEVVGVLAIVCLGMDVSVRQRRKA